MKDTPVKDRFFEIITQILSNLLLSICFHVRISFNNRLLLPLTIYFICIFIAAIFAVLLTLTILNYILDGL